MQKISLIISVIAFTVSITTVVYMKATEPLVVDVVSLVNNHKIKIYEDALKNKSVEDIQQKMMVLTSSIEDILKQYNRPIVIKQAVLNLHYKDITNEVNQKLEKALASKYKNLGSK